MALEEWVELKRSNQKMYFKEKYISLYGEVFTPFHIIDEMLAQIPDSAWDDPGYIFLEPACGTGNFLLAVLDKRIKHGIDIETALNTLIGMDINGNTLLSARDMLFEYAKQLYLEQQGIDKFRGGNDKRGQEHYRVRAVYASIIKNNIIQVKDSITFIKNKMPGWQFLFNNPLGEKKGKSVRSKSYQNAMVGVNWKFIKEDLVMPMFSEDISLTWEKDIKE